MAMMDVDMARKRIGAARNLLGEVDDMLERGDADALAPLTVLDVAKTRPSELRRRYWAAMARKRCRILIDLGTRRRL